MTSLSDFMILQRDANGYAHGTVDGIWKNGKAGGSKVFARVVREDDNLTIVYWVEGVCTDEGWKVDLTIPEGGPYRIEVAYGSKGWNDKVKCVYHVGVGDIYVTAGQSNMAGYGRDNAFDPPVLGVHAFGNNGKWCIAAQPMADGTESIFPYPETAIGTSPALSFARTLNKRLGVPVGIVPAAVGGSALAQWNPEERGDCYAGMCQRLEYVGDFKGYIWLQGCTDCNENDAPTYLDRFKRMKELWDEKFGKHPIITAQLNRWCGPEKNDITTDRCWGMIRNAQSKVAIDIEDVYCVPATDLYVTDGIHNGSGSNVIIGERMANTALACIYNKPGQRAPYVSSVHMIDDSHIFVEIKDGHDMWAMDNRAYGMNVEDEDGIMECQYAVPQEEGKGLIVNTTRPMKLPASFHYAWRTHPPVFAVRDFADMPLLSCYGVEIEK